MTKLACKSRKMQARAALACLQLAALLAWANEIETITVVGATPGKRQGSRRSRFPG